MKNYYFNYLIIILFLISGCSKKDTPPQNNQSINSLIKTITICDTNGTWLSTISYEYDNQSRLQKFYSDSRGLSNDTIHMLYSMEYNSSSIILIKTISSDSLFCQKIIYSLNSNALADSAIHVFKVSASDSTIPLRESFRYNSDNSRMTYVFCSNGGTPLTMSYFYLNSNVDYITVSPTNPSSSKELFFYDPSHYNTLSYFNAGVHFLGNSTKNPIIRARFETTAEDCANYSYEFDQSGKITHLSVRGGYSIMPGLDFYTVPIIAMNEELYYTYY